MVGSPWRAAVLRWPRPIHRPGPHGEGRVGDEGEGGTTMPARPTTARYLIALLSALLIFEAGAVAPASTLAQDPSPAASAEPAESSPEPAHGTCVPPDGCRCLLAIGSIRRLLAHLSTDVGVAARAHRRDSRAGRRLPVARLGQRTASDAMATGIVSRGSGWATNGAQRWPHCRRWSARVCRGRRAEELWVRGRADRP